MIETHLVDFKSLEQDTSAARRNELLKGVAALFAVAGDRCTLEQIEIYDDVLVRLAGMVESVARAAAAEKLASVRRAPEGIIRLLAADAEIEVAGPVLARSPVLTEADLIALAEARGVEHLAAIAKRSVLSEQLSDVVVRRGDLEVRRVVAANPGATLGENALSELVETAKGDIQLAKALGDRPDMPDVVIAGLVREAADEVRKALEGRGFKAEAERVEEAARHAGDRMSNAYWLGLYDFETAWERALSRGGRKAVTEAALCQAAVEDRFADVVATFALLAGLDAEETRHWLVRTDTEPFVVIAKALDLRLATVQAVLMTGPWRHRLTGEQRREALSLYNGLDPRLARARLEAWRETRLAG
jgi:uncharacterized protein (DUF2336 family)